MSLSREKKPTESEKLVKSSDESENGATEDMKINVKYQQESPLKYKGACSGKAGPAIVSTLDLFWILYVLYLEFQAIYCIYLLDFHDVSEFVQNYLGVPGHNATVTIDTQPMIGSTGWVALLSIAAAWSFGWLLWAIIVSSSNCQAIMAYRREQASDNEIQTTNALPFPPLKLTVWWSVFIFVLWGIVLGGAIYYYYFLFDTSSQLVELAGFLTLMFVVVLFGIFTTVLGVCRRLRDGWDACLRCCKSPCYEC